MKSKKALSKILVLALLISVLSSFGAVMSSADSSVLTVGPDKMFATPQEAYNSAQPGDTIEIYGDVYSGEAAKLDILGKDNVTFRGVGSRPKMELTPDVSLTSKWGVWVISANNITIENLEFTGAYRTDTTIPDRRNACGVFIGNVLNPTLKNCYIHDNDEGILTSSNKSSTITIENCEFAYNGFYAYSHNTYIGNIAQLNYRYNYSHHSRGEGHLLKTRANINFIEYNRLTDEMSNETIVSNSNIDISNGGTSYVIGNIMHQANNENSNWRMLSYAVEGAKNPMQDLYVINNTFINDIPGDDVPFIQLKNAAGVNAAIKNNIFTGQGKMVTYLGGGDILSKVDASNNLVNFDPVYADRGNFDYRLTAASVEAIDKGVNPGAGLSGYSLLPVKQYVHKTAAEARPVFGKLDIGAYEYGIAVGVDFDPNVIKLDDTNGMVTVYVSFPAEADLSAFALSNLKLNGVLSPITEEKAGYVKNVAPVANEDGLLQVMIKFNKQDVVEYAPDGIIVISGNLGDVKYAGKTTVKIK